MQTLVVFYYVLTSFKFLLWFQPMAGLNGLPGTGGRNSDPDHKSPRESGEDSEDECEILEESPCGRWLKRREEVCYICYILCYICQASL